MKKRYMFSLTAEKMERYKALAKEIGLPSNQLSKEIDALLDGCVSTFEKLRGQNGKLNLSDMLKLMGEQIGKLEKEEEESNEHKKRKKKGKAE